MGGIRGAGDPGRKDRIVKAALRVIAQHGVRKTTHRLIAEYAEVPIGSVTYYFDSIDALLESAFELYYVQIADRYENLLAEASNASEARRAIVEMLCTEKLLTSGDAVLLFEFYAFGNVSRTVRSFRKQWLERNQRNLSTHFSPTALRAIDALFEGWSLHAVFADDPLNIDEVETAIEALSKL